MVGSSHHVDIDGRLTTKSTVRDGMRWSTTADDGEWISYPSMSKRKARPFYRKTIFTGYMRIINTELQG